MLRKSQWKRTITAELAKIGAKIDSFANIDEKGNEFLFVEATLDGGEPLNVMYPDTLINMIKSQDYRREHGTSYCLPF